ncbi:GGDEF domain-containing response regulator [Denitromonas iodatirespirans]|uniref:diguanylate cyclase n=1 Tax=Denitromonas iodatirespirans TaxID=2795389 RepID=A0A944D8B6_DENI1|nr:diguanylate cyclase [Denitromonas iodatirespirans]MBT0960447.1 diguanylate cyclase [Denitromonas iodatirespirans]
MTDDKPRVLIVDDERSNISLLGNLLQPDCEVVVATDGESALRRAAAAARPDLILLDVMMPGMDGYQVCKQLKDSDATRDIPVIFITAMGEEDDEALGLRIGAVDYVTKPFSPAILKMRIRTHVELKRLRDHWQRLSTVDALTQIANRRCFDEALDTAWRSAMRQNQPLALIMADVDHFKAYNDHHGHAAGDDCLRRVAQALRQEVKRAGDLLARFGGEEFACLMTDVDLHGAETVAKRMCGAVTELALPHQHPAVQGTVSISMGLAVLVPNSAQSPTELIIQADRRLYDAKRGGRNRLCVGSAE